MRLASRAHGMTFTNERPPSRRAPSGQPQQHHHQHHHLCLGLCLCALTRRTHEAVVDVDHAFCAPGAATGLAVVGVEEVDVVAEAAGPEAVFGGRVIVGVGGDGCRRCE